jgi:hypothetical protein
MLMFAILTPAAKATVSPEESTENKSWQWSFRSLRESMALFPPSSVVKDLGDGRALTRLVRTKTATGTPPGGLIMPLKWLPDRSAVYMKSSLWIEEERRGDGSWRIEMVAVDGTTTTSVDFLGGKTRTRTEMAPLQAGKNLMIDETEASGEVRPPDCLELWIFRPGRFTSLTTGNAGDPMTAFKNYRGTDGSTISIMADLASKSLIQETISSSTSTVVLTAGRPFREGTSSHWPSQIVQRRLDPDGAVAQWTTHSLLKLDVRDGGSR